MIKMVTSNNNILNKKHNILGIDIIQIEIKISFGYLLDLLYSKHLVIFKKV